MDCFYIACFYRIKTLYNVPLIHNSVGTAFAGHLPAHREQLEVQCLAQGHPHVDKRGRVSNQRPALSPLSNKTPLI